MLGLPHHLRHRHLDLEHALTQPGAEAQDMFYILVPW
jgi:hypothetical protein